MIDFKATVKRLTSIFFLFILVFNFWGYRLMIDCLRQQQDARLTSQVDQEQYNDADLISIKTTLNLPYYSSSPDFERAYGSVNINGVDYEYVKRRVYHDTLELLCLPNEAKTQLQSVSNQFLKFSLDGQPTQPNKKSHNILKTGLPDFVQETAYIVQTMPATTEPVFNSWNTSLLPFGYSSRQERPPQPMQHFM